MNDRMLETVPNFSEGEDWDTIEGMVDAFKETTDVSYLDLHLDEDHNRSVITAAGPAAALRTALKEAVGVAINQIDISEHEGTHPYMGAADVIPFVPIDDTSMEEATEEAETLAEQLSDAYDLPTFLYANAARREHTRELSTLRKHSQEELNEKMQDEPDWAPDYGPSRCHPSGGATAVGSRDFLIAMNVDLLTEKVEVANDIAREVRESSGGLPGIQALGMDLSQQGRITVSTNITDYQQTSPFELVETIHAEAQKRDVKPGPTELVGLIPEEAIEGDDPEKLNIPRFDPERHVFERRLASVSSENVRV